MLYKKINSLQLYLNHGAVEVIETECMQDVGCGIYPSFYLKCDGKLKVSTSVVSLILNSGAFELNSSFMPPDYLGVKKNYQFLTNISWIAKRIISLLSFGLFKPVPSQSKSWYETWETIDKRIKKLKPFETVLPEESSIHFKPDYILKEKDIFASKAAYYIKRFVNNVEELFPDWNHVVMTGGKDSQLICLTPKSHPGKWHVFSAEPNYPLVKEWLDTNSIAIGNLYYHDNRNEETFQDFKKKVIAGDLYADPSHMKWMPYMKKIAEEFDNKCIFWIGTMSSPSHLFHGNNTYYAGDKRKIFFENHINKTSSWQGNYHQIFKNFVGCPILSPYHSEEIWDELFQHIDPLIIDRNMELRDDIGEILFGKPVKWLHQNPGPDTYNNKYQENLYSLYIEYIKENFPSENYKSKAIL